MIVARALTEASVDDATTGITLIEAVDGALGQVTADAAYGHCQVADERAFFSLGAERPSLGQQAHVTSSH